MKEENKKTSINKKDVIKAGLTTASITFICLTLIFTVSNAANNALQQNKIKEDNARFNVLFKDIQYDNNPAEECYEMPGNGKDLSNVYVARKDGKISGYAVEYDIAGGYSTPFRMIAGVTKDGFITYADVLIMNETPGLGDKILRSKGNYLDAYTGAGLRNKTFEIKKDGGDFDYFTGASVTPRAVARSTGRMLVTLTQENELTKLKKCSNSKEKTKKEVNNKKEEKNR